MTNKRTSNYLVPAVEIHIRDHQRAVRHTPVPFIKWRG